ncbi:MAG: ParB/RepB/Spo0J family partition protein [Ruminococcaceae bacterium]|nr:ParB/RepB/Spo0J family partition protein [Oscillospiraceae bacterium]
MANKRGLGRNFYDILDDNTLDLNQEGVASISIGKIEPRRDQPRKDFDQAALQTLADSIAEHGVIQPIVVREYTDPSLAGNYEIIAGERRWRAAKMAGLNEIPVVVMTGDDLKMAQVALIENLQRRDLNTVEEALAYKALIEKFNMTQEELARQVGKNRSTITNILRLLDLPDDVLLLLRENKISMGHARALLALEMEEDMSVLANRIVEKEYSVREVERAVKLINSRYHETPEEEEPVERVQKRIYMKDLEQKAMKAMGRKVKINQTGKKKTVELSFEDDADLEELLTKLCGDEIFN